MGIVVPIVVEGRSVVAASASTTVVKRPPALVSLGRRQSSRRLLVDNPGGRRGSVGGGNTRPRCIAATNVATAAKGGEDKQPAQLTGRRGSVGKKVNGMEASLAR